MTSTTLPRGRFHWAQIKRSILGAPGAQSDRASYSLLAALVFFGSAGLQQFEVWGGLVDQLQSNWLTAYNLAGATSFFIFIRLGKNLRFKTDPSMSFAQCLFGVTSVCGSYAITGPARGAVMAIMLLILAFAMFALKPVRIQQLSALAVGLLLAVMVWKGLTDPARYPPLVEASHATLLVILVSSIAVLSQRMGSLRALLQRQKAELQHAVEVNRGLATLDELTGLINRRHMGEILRTEHERQKRGGDCMSIALIDIDFFKRINDEFGHAAGDTVLREFAQLASITMRSGDTIARWGGEEFLVLMPTTNAAEARHAIERLRREFSMLYFPNIAVTMRASFSAGIATHLDLDTIEEFVDRADQCMYAAKGSGRNRVCTEEAPLPPSFVRARAALECPTLQ